MVILESGTKGRLKNEESPRTGYCTQCYTENAMQKFSALLIFLSACFLLTASAAKAAAVKSKSPNIAGSVAKNRLSVSTTFSNLTNVRSVKYSLTYDSNKGLQGAGGTIKVAAKDKTLSRKLLLGTCSKNVCTYHRNVKNLKLSVDFTLKSGGVISYEKILK